MSEAVNPTGMPTVDQAVVRKHLAHHFDTPQQQFDSGKLGMWLFLTTELLLFSGLFCAYAVYRALHPEIFQFASQYLDPTSGLINTLVLLTSGLTMALGVRFAQTGKTALLAICLVLTMLGGLTFIAIHADEYFEKYQQKLLWGTNYDPKIEKPAPAAKAGTPGSYANLRVLKAQGYIEAHSTIMPASIGPAGVAAKHVSATTVPLIPEPHNVQIFFGIYFLMTGLHSIHVIIGVILMGWLLVRSLRGDFGPNYYNPVDFVGMYWGIVDMVWMFLFPLLYLIR